jgi:hypothetical protein
MDQLYVFLFLFSVLHLLKFTFNQEIHLSKDSVREVWNTIISLYLRKQITIIFVNGLANYWVSI